MPELPDVIVYVEALDRFLTGRVIERVQLRSPFVVRSFEPDLETVEGLQIRGFQRLGKRIVWSIEKDLFLVFHLMIAGRYHWRRAGASPRSKTDLIAFQFDNGTLMFTEAAAKKRASLHVVCGVENVEDFRPSGLETLDCDFKEFQQVLRARNHTVKRALTDPNIFSGIGNAYSDEILHAAGLSPIKWTSRLSEAEVDSLYVATRETLTRWTDRLRDQVGDRFPEKVTAFRPEMAAHGKFGQPCPICQSTIQRIIFADRETNYCPGCQTNGRILADRSLSRLLKDDWPRSIEELDA